MLKPCRTAKHASLFLNKFCCISLFAGVIYFYQIRRGTIHDNNKDIKRKRKEVSKKKTTKKNELQTKEMKTEKKTKKKIIRKRNMKRKEKDSTRAHFQQTRVC